MGFRRPKTGTTCEQEPSRSGGAHPAPRAAIRKLGFTSFRRNFGVLLGSQVRRPRRFRRRRTRKYAVQTVFPKRDQSVRRRIAQRPEQHRVDDAKDRRIRPDTQRQREHRHSGEAGILQQMANGEAEVLHWKQSESAACMPSSPPVAGPAKVACIDEPSSIIHPTDRTVSGTVPSHPCEEAFRVLLDSSNEGTRTLCRRSGKVVSEDASRWVFPPFSDRSPWAQRMNWGRGWDASRPLSVNGASPRRQSLPGDVVLRRL